MKKLNILFLLLSFNFYGQIKYEKRSSIMTIVEFQIRDARENGNDITPAIIKDEAALYFYNTIGEDEISFTGYWKKLNYQCYGKVYAIKKDVILENDSEYEIEKYDFYWSYQTTDGDEPGTDSINLEVMYKPQGTYFKLTIQSESLDVQVYRGEMLGDLGLFERYIEKSNL